MLGVCSKSVKFSSMAIFGLMPQLLSNFVARSSVLNFLVAFWVVNVEFGMLLTVIVLLSQLCLIGLPMIVVRYLMILIKNVFKTVIFILLKFYYLIKAIWNLRLLNLLLFALSLKSLRLVECFPDVGTYNGYIRINYADVLLIDDIWLSILRLVLIIDDDMHPLKGRNFITTFIYDLLRAVALHSCI